MPKWRPHVILHISVFINLEAYFNLNIRWWARKRIYFCVRMGKNISQDHRLKLLHKPLDAKQWSLGWTFFHFSLPLMIEFCCLQIRSTVIEYSYFSHRTLKTRECETHVLASALMCSYMITLYSFLYTTCFINPLLMMDLLIHIDTISMALPMVPLKGSQVKSSTIRNMSVPEGCSNHSKQGRLCIMLHFIWVYTVCHCLGVSSIQKCWNKKAAIDECDVSWLYDALTCTCIWCFKWTV